MKKDIRPGKEIFMPPTDTRRKLEQDLNCYSMTKLQTDLAPYFKFAQKYRLYYVDSTARKYTLVPSTTSYQKTG